MRAILTLETTRFTRPMTKRHIPEDLQQHRCQSADITIHSPFARISLCHALRLFLMHFCLPELKTVLLLLHLHFHYPVAKERNTVTVLRLLHFVATTCDFSSFCFQHRRGFTSKAGTADICCLRCNTFCVSVELRVYADDMRCTSEKNAEWQLVPLKYEYFT